MVDTVRAMAKLFYEETGEHLCEIRLNRRGWEALLSEIAGWNGADVGMDDLVFIDNVAVRRV